MERHETLQFLSRRVVIKIGSSALTEGAENYEPLNIKRIDNIARQCSKLYKKGVKIAVISSGAVACGRHLLESYEENDTADRQVEAAFGQPFLIKTWIDSFDTYGINTAQVLLSETDLDKAKLPLTRAMEKGIVVINANDSVSDQEMQQFMVSADNDRLAEFVTKAIEADTLLILTDVEGVLDSNGNLIANGDKIDIEALNGISDKGTGGMKSKVQVARNVSQSGINSYIANAGDRYIIIAVAKGEALGNCTSFKSKSVPN